MVLWRAIKLFKSTGKTCTIKRNIFYQMFTVDRIGSAAALKDRFRFKIRSFYFMRFKKMDRQEGDLYAIIYTCCIYIQKRAILPVNRIMLILKMKQFNGQLFKIIRRGSKNLLFKVNIFNGMFQYQSVNLNY